MNYFEKNRLYLFIIIILVIFNISAIAAIIYHFRSERHPRGMHEGEYKRGFHLADSIGFSKAQAVQFDSMRAQFGRNNREIMGNIESLKHDMMAEISSDNPDTAKLRHIAIEIGTLHTQQKLITIDHFAQLKKLCTPEQAQKLNAIFHKMFKLQEGMPSRGGKQLRHGEGWDNRPFVQEDYPF